MKKIIFIFILFICGVAQSQVIYSDFMIVNESDTIKNAIIKINADNTGFIKTEKDTCLFKNGNFKDILFLSNFSNLQPLTIAVKIKDENLTFHINMIDINYSFDTKITNITNNAERSIFGK
jgi:multisubunit Na+/H+ antiporter MnhE subunit